MQLWKLASALLILSCRSFVASLPTGTEVTCGKLPGDAKPAPRTYHVWQRVDTPPETNTGKDGYVDMTALDNYCRQIKGKHYDTIIGWASAKGGEFQSYHVLDLLFESEDWKQKVSGEGADVVANDEIRTFEQLQPRARHEYKCWYKGELDPSGKVKNFGTAESANKAFCERQKYKVGVQDCKTSSDNLIDQMSFKNSPTPFSGESCGEGSSGAQKRGTKGVACKAKQKPTKTTKPAHPTKTAKPHKPKKTKKPKASKPTKPKKKTKQPKKTKATKPKKSRKAKTNKKGPK